MIEQEAKEPIKIYLDDSEEPFKVAHPPLRFSLSTIPLADGAHTLRVEASNGLAPPTVKEIPFRVRNGVAVTVSGLEAGQTIGGQVELIVNAYAGNTEVDFEPRRAETPQPIPTWAWVLSLAVLAWTMFYVFNPARPPRDAATKAFTVDRTVGERLYMDTCARCHDEDGTGRRSATNPDDFIVKRLRDTPNLAVDETPYKLLFKVVTGTRSSSAVQMPAWGPRLTNEEIVAVVNYVRSSWGHDASQIEPTYRRPPPGIDELEENILDAMVGKDADRLETCCWPEGVRPQLYRIDGPRWAVGKANVIDEWRGYFEALGKGEIIDFQLTDVRYAYEPEAVENVGAYVFAMGRIFLSTRAENGVDESDTGRFIRVYRRIKRSSGESGTAWALVFDFASIRMRVGCEVDGTAVDCPPGHQPNGSTPVEVDLPANQIGYAEVQAMLAALKKDPGDAPHERFWEEDYETFINMEFPPTWDDAGELSIKMLVVGNSAESNLIKAMRDGKGITVTKADGSVARVNIQPMPKGSKMDPAQVDKLAAWIDAGCPEVAGEPGGAAKPPVKSGGSKEEASTGSGPIGYEGFKDIFASLGRDPGDAPHDRFWELPYEELVGQSFPWSWDDPEMTVAYVVPWDSKSSNLIKALIDGKGIEVRLPDGRLVRKNIKRMPKGASAMEDEDIQRIADWIDAGCPKEPGGTSPWPKPGAAAQPPSKGDAPKKAAAQDEPKKGAAAPDAPAKPLDKDVGYAEIQSLFAGLRRDPGDAPHERFWENDYEEFVAFEFPLSWDDVGEKSIKLLVVGNSAESNLIKALRGGKGITVTRADGSTEQANIPMMPKGSTMDAAQIDVVAAWIDAGCPEVAGQKPGGAAAENDPPSPPPPAPREPAVAQPKVSALGYAEVVKIFKALRQKAPNAPHSNFWRELSWREFIEFEFPEGPGREGMIRMVVPYDSASSNLIKALKDGKGLTVRFPDGKVVVRDYAPMPKDADPMPSGDIQKLADWIDAGCPEHAGKPSTLKK